MIDCRECNGTGEVELRSLRCHHNGACPCATVTADCDHCEGTGAEPCLICGDRPAVEIVDGDPCCAPCAAEMKEELESDTGTLEAA